MSETRTGFLRLVSVTPAAAATFPERRPVLDVITSDETHWPSTIAGTTIPKQGEAITATLEGHTFMAILRTGYTPATRHVPVHLMEPLKDGGTRSFCGQLLGMERCDGVLRHYRIRDDAGVVREVPLAWLSPGSRLAVVRAGLGMPDASSDTRDVALLELFEAWLSLERERIAIEYRGPAAAADPKKPEAYRGKWQDLADKIGRRMAHSTAAIAAKAFVLRALVQSDPAYGVQFEEQASPVMQMAWRLAADILVRQPWG